MSLRPAATLVAMITLALPLTAQRLWTSPGGTPDLAVRVTHIFSRNNNFGDLGSFLVDLDGEAPIGHRLGVEAELPLSDFHFQGSGDSHAGNPYVGLHFAPQANLGFRVGIRPGLFAQQVDGLAAIGGAYADFDHFEAWAGKRTAVRGMMEFGDVAQRRSSVTGYLGATYISGDVIDGFGATAETTLDYGIRFGYRDESVNAGLTLTGRYLLHPDGGGFDGRDNNQVALGIESARGSVRPMLSVGTFLDEGIRDDGLRVVASVGIRLVQPQP